MINNQNIINNLILIGGGVMRRGETVKIDRWMIKEIKKKSGIKNPRVLFVPSASRDLKEYVQDFTKRYLNYGATVNNLYLVKETPPKNIIIEDFLDADLIYFGGGSAELLLETFRKFDLESICIQAIKNKALICGLSAGAIIWGRNFLTFDRKEDKLCNFRIKKGLSRVNGLIIPHFDASMLGNKEVSNLLKSKLSMEVLALGNGTAAYWEDKPTPLFIKQRKSCWGLSVPLKDLIQKYE